MNKNIIYIIAIVFLAFPVSADTVYYCDEFQNSTGLFCEPITTQTIMMNNVTNTIGTQYTSAINDLETIQKTSPGFNQAGFNQTVWAVKREAQIEEWVLKFLKIIYEIIT